MKRIALIGCGYSGMAFATYLDHTKYSLTIYEQANRLGGRASSFIDQKNKFTLDNGQHMLMACYKDTLNFFNIININQEDLLIEKKMSIQYYSKKYGFYTFRSNPFLPAPLHLSISLFFDLKPISLKEKLLLLRAFIYLVYSKKMHHYTVEESLKILKQSDNLYKYIWNPIIISIFNEENKYVRTKDLAEIIRILFFEKNSNANVILSRLNLSELIHGKFELFCKKKAIGLKIQDRVKEIYLNKDNKYTVNNNEYDYVVSSIPLLSLKRLIDIDYSAYSTRSILTVYFDYKDELFPGNFVGLPESKFHWIFNLKKIHRFDNNLYSVVISNADEYVKYSQEDFRKTLLNELTIFFPQFKIEKFRYIKTIHEKRATYTSDSKYKPGEYQNNFFICGDWTDTSLPSTIESAVRSGKILANYISNL